MRIRYPYTANASTQICLVRVTSDPSRRVSDRSAHWGEADIIGRKADIDRRRKQHRMTDEISYFDAASFLADIEADYADIGDTVERTEKLVARLTKRWPSLTVTQAVAYVRLFEAS